MQIVLAIVVAPVLWLIGAVAFDFVHFVLHAFLRSRWRLLRALAWPHGIHHRWIDRDLEVQWAYQRRNVWCHIVPEYATQLVFTAGVALLLPPPFAVALFALQTLVFLSILRARGLDLNHRPIDMLDAYRPGPWTPPAYHALHHVHPDACYSAYTKVVDFLVRGAAPLRGRRFLLRGASGPFARALAAELRRNGVEDVTAEGNLDRSTLAAADVLVLCDEEREAVPILEALIDATRTRRLPPEAWVVQRQPVPPAARHYLDDVRIQYRALLAPASAGSGEREAERAARRAVSRIRRGFHIVPTAPLPRALREWWRLRGTPSVPPAHVQRVRHRKELLEPA